MKCVGMALLLMCLISFPCIAAASKSKNSDKEKVIAAVQGDFAEGKIKSDENRCQECHGADGNGQSLNKGAAGQFAKLAGQYPDYFTKQIRDFRTGERKSDFMQIMAKSIDDSDAADIAAYFSSQKKMQGDGSGDNPMGKNLFVTGDASRNILPCASCHGVVGKGVELVAQTIPVIGGQDKRYLESQLQSWRSGERHNSAGGVMNTIAKQLTDVEVQALTDYISGL
jgi:cytochrome c553